MSVSYFKRFRMEFDLRGCRSIPINVPQGYRLLAWQPELLPDHAEAKYLSFRNEIDASHRGDEADGERTNLDNLAAAAKNFD